MHVVRDTQRSTPCGSTRTTALRTLPDPQLGFIIPQGMRFKTQVLNLNKGSGYYIPGYYIPSCNLRRVLNPGIKPGGGPRVLTLSACLFQAKMPIFKVGMRYPCAYPGRPAHRPGPPGSGIARGHPRGVRGAAPPLPIGSPKPEICTDPENGRS